MSVWEDVTDVGGGLAGLLTDGPSLIGNVAEGDVHGIITDGRNVIGNVADMLGGMEGLGVTLGEVPKRYLGNIAKIADSKILAAAQLAIDGQKQLTGDGEPEGGSLYKESAARLEGALNETIDANRSDDRWNGAASDEYQKRNDAHRKLISATAAADAAISKILEVEAGQVAHTRNTLDDTSQALYDFGLATSWMNFVPPLIPAKAAADSAAATTAMATTLSAMAALWNDSQENAKQISALISDYNSAAEDTSGDDTGCGGGIISQTDDLARQPTRILKPGHYTVPETDIEYGPPATPFGVLGQIPGAAPGPAPAPSPTPAPRSPKPTAPPSPPPQTPQPVPRSAPAPVTAAPDRRSAENAPLPPAPQRTRTASTRVTN
ncbi:EspA/EspE family type VII secretion system effector [Mycolicibacterium iranicum]|uniref:EspA/EspE family type VII secretion system effector n=1 Tax=Mycolicibacterium iranicum TaxID=912594 RepID=UPI000685E70E|nr:EspA/EspE family type VII secretion system effector [Mycolicibacterium iranicum]